MTAPRVIPYGPRLQLVPYHLRRERWSALVAHRRFGKTVGLINDTIAKAFNNKRKFPEPKYAFVAPYLAQAKENAWGYLKHYAAPAIVDSNETELWVQLVTGGRIRLHGADNPDRLRGAYLDGVVCDEYADWRPGVFDEVIRPMLADYQGWATFLGTPKGRNAFWRVYEEAKSDPEWFCDIFRASETGIIPEEELRTLRAGMTPEAYAQEFECSFDAAVAGTYWGRELEALERDGRVTSVEPVPGLPVNTTWDLGMSDAMSIWFWQVVGQELHVLDYYENTGFGFDHYADVIRRRGYALGDHYLPHDARVRELGSGRSRVQTLANLLGRQPLLVPNAKFMDGINAGRLTLPVTWFDRERTKDGLEALKLYREAVDKKTKLGLGHEQHDWTAHAGAAWRYTSLTWRAKAAPAPPPKQVDLKRPALAQVTVDELLASTKKVRNERV